MAFSLSIRVEAYAHFLHPKEKFTVGSRRGRPSRPAAYSRVSSLNQQLPYPSPPSMQQAFVHRPLSHP